VAKDPAVSEKMEWMRRFGHKGQEAFHGVGTNAKMSEFHAAMGLCNFKHINTILDNRKAICEAYDHALFKSPSLTTHLSEIHYRVETTRNYSYYPVLFRREEQLLEAVSLLNKKAIFPRRYFYPSLSSVPEIVTQTHECPVSDTASSSILCLPLAVDTDHCIIDAVLSSLISQN
jgi:dTDP-4-amino-4,6-dideoxygalactose transaminase